MKSKGSKKVNRSLLSVVTRRTNQVVNSTEFLATARKRGSDFTRNRKMPFNKLVIFMLNMIKSSIQNCLDSFFEKIEEEEIHMSQQSFSEARDKIRWEAFQELYQMTVDVTYEGYSETWLSYRVSAIDGTKVQLPSDKKLREHFGTSGRAGTSVTAQASALYDICNRTVIDAQLMPMATGERELAMLHIDALCKHASFDKECLLFDRGYASFELIEALKARGISFVMRVKSKFNNEIDALDEGDHYVVLQQKGHADITVRVLKFPLSSGEIETLITDIGDRRLGINGFKVLYFKRWPIETKYDEIKNKLEVENFSGRTINSIYQDFFITMYMANVASIAYWEAQPIVEDERAEKDNQYDYHVNMNHAIGTLKDRFILAVLETNPIKRKEKLERIILLLKHHVVPMRPNRSIPRNPSPRKSKFHHNKKSNCR